MKFGLPPALSRAFDDGFCFLYCGEGFRRSDGEVQTFRLER